MMGLPANDSPDCFWQADLATAAAELAKVIVDVRPQVVVTYDANGFYGHPDHIQAHRVTAEAIVRAARSEQGRPWQVAKFYATAMPRSVAQAWDLPPVYVPDDQVTTEIDGTAYLAAKTAALRAHATQCSVTGDHFALADGRWQAVLGKEFYTLLAWGGDPPGTPRGADGAWPASRQAPLRISPGTPDAGTPATLRIVTDRDELLQVINDRAVVRGDFVLSSGQHADWYIDLRRVLLSGASAALAGRVMLAATADLDYEAVGGLTLGADPVATAMMHAAVVLGRNLDAFVVRKSEKAHGLQRRIEGPDVTGRRVLAVEDTSTTGTSVLTAVGALRDAGAVVAGVAVLVDRGARAAVTARGLEYRAAYGVGDLCLG
jgi:orotate phosphoribosyltransferase